MCPVSFIDKKMGKWYHIESKDSVGLAGAPGLNDNVNIPYKEGLRIMQLTDLHLVRWDGKGPEQQMLDMIDAMIAAEKPDLLVITGDLACTDMPVSYYRGFCAYMDAKGLPWTMCMGNHDAERSPGYAHLERILMQSASCLYRHGLPEADGYGNFTLSLTAEDGKPMWMLYFLDTHPQSYLTRTQTAWYRQRRDAAGSVPSLAFMHAPFREFADLWEAGAQGVMLDGDSHLSGDGGMLAAMEERGNLKGVFVGHDHVNDFFGMHGNLFFAYGRGTCMGGVDVDGVRRGGYLRQGFVPGCRMIVLHRDGFETYIRLKDGRILYKEAGGSE